MRKTRDCYGDEDGESGERRTRRRRRDVEDEIRN